MTLVWHGITELEAKFVEVSAKMETATRAAVLEAAHVVQAGAMRETAAHGRHAKGTPTPASPGSGPSQISGSLTRSIRVGPVTQLGPNVMVMVGPTMVYSRRVELEFNYPYMGPGLRLALPSLPATYARAWSRAWR